LTGHILRQVLRPTSTVSSGERETPHADQMGHYRMILLVASLYSI